MWLVVTWHCCCHVDLPAGHPVKILVGFSNKGSQDFIIESMNAAFRYPQDYSFYIQNVRTTCFKNSLIFDVYSVVINFITAKILPVRFYQVGLLKNIGDGYS